MDVHRGRNGGGQLVGRGDGAVAHEAAAHVGRGRRRRRAAGRPAAARRAHPAARRRPPCRRGRPRRARSRSSGPSPATATCSGPATCASAAVSQCPAKRGCSRRRVPAPCSAASAASRYRPPSVGQHRRREQRRGQRGAPARRRVVGDLAGPVQQRLRVVGGVVGRRLPSTKCARATSSSSVAAASHRGAPVAWCSASRPSASAAWSSSTPAAAPTTPSREERRSRPSTTWRSNSRSAARAAAATHSGRSSAAPALRERDDRQPVPRRDHLVVARGLRTLGARGQQRGLHAAPAHGIGRVDRELQRGGAVLERAAVGDREQLRGPGAVLGAQHVAELGGGPGVGLALDAVGVGVERGREAALGGDQVAEQEPGRLVGHAQGERRAGDPVQVRVDRGAAARCRRASSRSAAPPSCASTL